MTDITFDQTLPSETPGRVPASGRVEITRGQRTVNGTTTLLPGKVGEMLVNGYATIENVLPTGPNEFVMIEYKTKHPYVRFVQVPDAVSKADTELPDVALSTLEPSYSSIPAWDIATAAAAAALADAEAAAVVAVAAKNEAVEAADGMLVGGSVVGDDLILERNDETTVNAGNVRGPAGADGPPGDPGADGPPGDPGADGAPGTVWHQGSSAPSGGTGINGDYYLNTTNGDVYQKSGGAWGSPIGNIMGVDGSAGADGTDGADGSKWYDGTGAPGSGLGVNGDYYLNDSNGDVYLKSSGTWSVAGNIKGPQGEQGEPGTPGTPGAGVTWLGGWNNATAYDEFDAVEYAGSAYIANATNTNKTPGVDPEWDLWVEKGTPGDDGVDGADGTDGTLWYSGSGAPAGGTGVNGDHYLNTANGDVYFKSAGSWSVIGNLTGPAGTDGADGSNGADGADGADGATLRSGAGAPSGGLGSDGDYYLNTTNGDVYTKAAGSWGSPVANFKGPQGDAGTAGTNGTNGTNGLNGFSASAYTHSGAVTVAAGTVRLYNDTGRTLTIAKVRAYAVTGPTGGALTVDVHKNGTTIFTTQGNRPSIASGANTATGVPDVTSWADGEYLTVDVDVVNGTPADLVVSINAS